jgi:hypothetical protein
MLNELWDCLTLNFLWFCLWKSDGEIRAGCSEAAYLCSTLALLRRAPVVVWNRGAILIFNVPQPKY